MNEQFKGISATIDENKNGSTRRILIQFFSTKATDAFNSVSEIDGLNALKNSHMRGELDHVVKKVLMIWSLSENRRRTIPWGEIISAKGDNLGPGFG